MDNLYQSWSATLGFLYGYARWMLLSHSPGRIPDEVRIESYWISGISTSVPNYILRAVYSKCWSSSPVMTSCLSFSWRFFAHATDVRLLVGVAHERLQLRIFCFVERFSLNAAIFLSLGAAAQSLTIWNREQ